MSYSDVMWWGYLHRNGTVQVKRWFGDHRDYTEDCENNPFVIRVVPPFAAETKEEATEYIANYFDSLGAKHIGRT